MMVAKLLRWGRKRFFDNSAVDLFLVSAGARSCTGTEPMKQRGFLVVGIGSGS
jgi:hypothetical protein